MQETLSHYRILEQIGAGGMGVVYRAHDEHLDCDVALKVLPAGEHAEDGARRRFRKEARTLSKLNHPNIAVVHDFDSQEGIDFLVQEYIQGISLDSLLVQGPLPESEVVKLGAQMADGIAAAHDHGVIHRDLKPGNLRVTPDQRLKILDFGLAMVVRGETDQVAVTESITIGDGFSGTLPYMAPEQMLGRRIDRRTDIWAAGCVLYEMATGKRAFPGSGPALVEAILHEEPVPPTRLNVKLSAAMEAIILKCLEKDPELRYQSAREIAVDLRRTEMTSTRTATMRVPPVRPSRMKRPLMYAAAAVALIAAMYLVPKTSLWRKLWGEGTGGSVRSLAVLPLENLSGNKEQEYFVEGMHDELITTLGTIGSLKVISRTSVMQYKDQHKPLREVAKELGVDAVIEGAVRREGDQVRISVALVEGKSDRQLWAASYQRELRDALALQSDVARAVAEQIQLAITPQEQQRLTRAGPANAEAHDAYLKGRYYWNKRTSDDIQKSIGYFKQASQLDPNYALAYAGLAEGYYVAAAHDYMPPEMAYAQAENAAKRALQLDDSLAEAHASLAGVKMSQHDWTAAEREYRQSIALNPSYATAYQWYSIFLSAMGRFDEAEIQVKKASELDPFSLIISDALGWPLYLSHQYDKAIEQYKKTLDRDPDFLPAHFDLGRSYLRKGMLEDAIRVHERMDKLSKGHPTTRIELAHTYAVAGRRQDASKILHAMTELSKSEYVSAYDMARGYAALGEQQEALNWLDKAAAERSDMLVNLMVDPDLDPLRSNARFKEFARRMNFPT